jgi:DNA-directed RNA polymerase subunit RPC12/RpoP
MDDKLVVIAEYRDLPQAGLAQSTLEANGVQCFLENQYMVGVNWLYSTALGGIKLKVREGDVRQANEILKTFDVDCSEGADEEKLTPGAACPLCGSTKIITKNYTRKFAAISLLLSLPLFFFLKRNSCQECGHRWK